MSYTRYFLNYRDPKTGRRLQPSFDRRGEAEAARNEIVAAVGRGGYSDRREAPTVGQAVDHWLRAREGHVKATTMMGYRVIAAVITGPLLSGTAEQRATHTRTGEKPAGADLLPMLGGLSTVDLSTAEIRRWHSQR